MADSRMDRPGHAPGHASLVPTPAPDPVLLRAGGALGIAATIIGLAILLLACFGFNAAFLLSPVPVALAMTGLVLSVIAICRQGDCIAEQTHVFLAFFTTLTALAGGLLEIAVWRGWPIFPH